MMICLRARKGTIVGEWVSFSVRHDFFSSFLFFFFGGGLLVGRGGEGRGKGGRTD